jgi:hypothetical protein
MSRFLLPYQRAYDNNGNVLPGAKLIFTDTGTSTPKNTYSDIALTIANANPVEADSQGQFGPIFLEAGEYRVELTDANDVTQTGYPEDNVQAAVDPTQTQTITNKTINDCKGLEMDGVINAARGADVPSEAALFTTSGFPTDGNSFNVTGTDAITSILTSGNIGTEITLIHKGIAVLTHNATDLICITSANITTSDGDISKWEEYASGDWRMTKYQKISGAALIAGVAGGAVQVVNVQDGTVATGSTIIPYDDSIPQNTEGDEYMTLAITPTSASNKLKIEVVFNGTQALGGGALTVALFQDSTASAIAVSGTQHNGSWLENIKFTHFMTAGTTLETIFKIRAGSSSTTTTFNGVATAQKYGGSMASSITITEIQV